MLLQLGSMAVPHREGEARFSLKGLGAPPHPARTATAANLLQGKPFYFACTETHLT